MAKATVRACTGRTRRGPPASGRSRGPRGNRSPRRVNRFETYKGRKSKLFLGRGLERLSPIRGWISGGRRRFQGRTPLAIDPCPLGANTSTTPEPSMSQDGRKTFAGALGLSRRKTEGRPSLALQACQDGRRKEDLRWRFRLVKTAAMIALGAKIEWGTPTRLTLGACGACGSAPPTRAAQRRPEPPTPARGCGGCVRAQPPRRSLRR